MMVKRDAVGVPASMGDMFVFGVAVTSGGDIATPVVPGVGKVARAIPGPESVRVGNGKAGKGDASRRVASDVGRELIMNGTSTEKVAPPRPLTVTTLSWPPRCLTYRAA